MSYIIYTIGSVKSVEEYRVSAGGKGGIQIDGDEQCGWALVNRVENAIKG